MMMRSRPWWATACIVVVATACERNTPAMEGAATRDSAGVQIVENTATQNQLQLEQVLRIGAVDTAGPQSLSQVFALAQDDSGTIYVGNNGSASIRVFDAYGRFLREFGGRGDGPAEVHMVNGVIAARDTVILYDYQGRVKTVLFTKDGQFLGSRIVRDSANRRLIPLGRTARGWLWQGTNTGGFRAPPGDSVAMFSTIARKSFDDDLHLDTVYHWQTGYLYGSRGEGVGLPMFPTFRSGVVGEDGRLYLSSNRAYQIDVYDGDTLRRSIRRNYEPLRISSALIRDVTDGALHVIDTMSRLPESERPAQRAQVQRTMEDRAKAPMPETIAPIGTLLVSRDGSFWVRRADRTPVADAVARMFGFWGAAPVDTTEWDLFDSTGHYTGTVTLPARFRAELVDGGTVTGVLYDSLDVEYVARYRVAATRDGGDLRTSGRN